MRIAVAISILAGAIAVASAPASEDKPTVEFHPDSESKKTETPGRRKPPAPVKGPEAPFAEARGEFTRCAAVHLLRLELSQRMVEFFVQDKMTDGRIERDRRSQRMLDTLDSMAGGAGCVDGDSVVAEQIMKLRQDVVDHPEFIRRAMASAPLGTYTAARASRVLNEFPGIHKNRRLRSVPDPCLVADAICESEIERRNAILAGVAAELKAVVTGE